MATNYFSEEMVFLILSHLPVISLLRFKSVCKTWLSIINSPQFVEAHLANSRNKQASVLKASYYWGVFSMDSVEESVKLKLPSRLEGMVYYMRSCNGLVCLSNESSYDICIWNPCTRQYKMLYAPNYEINQVGVCLGFGFDSVGNDYKILRIVTKVVRNTWGSIINMGNFSEAQLYSANADTWKMIRTPDTIKMSFWHKLKRFCGPDISGKLYMEGEGELLPFDLRNDLFGEIVVLPFPDYVEQKRIKKSKILDFEGSVAMVYESAGDESVLSLWMLDDVGLWIKKFNLEMDLELDRTYLYLGAQHFLGLNFVFGYKFYNYTKKTTKKLPFPAHLTDVKSVAKFTQSLVSLEGFQSQE
ncbi:hypothetical protein ACET3Z_029580 [Daucus carota]